MCPRITDAVCERGGPFGDIAGAHADHHVALGREIAEVAAEIIEVRNGTDHAMTVGAKALCQGVGIDALDRLLASGINRHDKDHVGVIEGALEVIHQRLKPGVAVRLNDGDHSAFGTLPRGGEHRSDLGRMVCVIVDDDCTVDLADMCEAALNTFETFEPGNNCFIGNA